MVGIYMRMEYINKLGKKFQVIDLRGLADLRKYLGVELEAQRWKTRKELFRT